MMSLPNLDWKAIAIGILIGVVIANKIRSVVPIPQV